jgi:hypothetical protein
MTAENPGQIIKKVRKAKVKRLKNRADSMKKFACQTTARVLKMKT